MLPYDILPATVSAGDQMALLMPVRVTSRAIDAAVTVVIAPVALGSYVGR